MIHDDAVINRIVSTPSLERDEVFGYFFGKEDDGGTLHSFSLSFRFIRNLRGW